MIALPCRRRWLLGAAALLLVAAPAPSQERPADPKDSAVVYVARKEPSLLPGLAPGRPDPEEHKEFLRNQAALLKSPLVLRLALRDPKVATLPAVKDQPNPVAWLEENLRVEFPVSELMRISFRAGPVQTRVALVNAVTLAYLREAVKKERNDRGERLKKLQDLHADYEDILKEKGRTLRALYERTGLGPDAETGRQKRRALYTELAEVRRELRQRRLAQAATRARLKGAGVEGSTRGAQLREELAALAAEEKVLREDLADVGRRIREAEQAALALEELRRDLGETEWISRRMARQITVLQVESVAPARVRLLQDARVP
jgi:hypothetical protein